MRTSIKKLKSISASGAEAAMKEGTQEEMVMTRGLEKKDDMKEEEDGTIGGTVEMKDKTETKKRKTRKNTRT